MHSPGGMPVGMFGAMPVAHPFIPTGMGGYNNGLTIPRRDTSFAAAGMDFAS